METYPRGGGGGQGLQCHKNEETAQPHSVLGAGHSVLSVSVDFMNLENLPLSWNLPRCLCSES